MGGTTIENINSFNILGVDISKSLKWRNHIVDVAKRASRRVSVLRKVRDFITAEHALLLYKAQIRPVMEYNSFPWESGGNTYLKLLDNIEQRAFEIINNSLLVARLDSLSHRRTVAGMCLFY